MKCWFKRKRKIGTPIEGYQDEEFEFETSDTPDPQSTYNQLDRKDKEELRAKYLRHFEETKWQKLIRLFTTRFTK